MVDELARLPVIAIDAQLVIEATAGSLEWGASLWDALIIRAAETSAAGSSYARI